LPLGTATSGTITITTLDPAQHERQAVCSVPPALGGLLPDTEFRREAVSLLKGSAARCSLTFAAT